MVIWERNIGVWVYSERHIIKRNGEIILEVDLLTVYVEREGKMNIEFEY